MKKSFLFTLLVIGTHFLLNSCNQTKNKQISDNYNNQSQPDSTEVKSFVYSKYKLPLSVDIYKFLKSRNVEFNRQNILDLGIQDKFFTDEKRALALGMYSSDLICTTINDISQESINYFSVSMEFASKLDIEDGYNSNLLDKANLYIDNSDSLTRFANDAYWKTCTNLEKNKRDNVLPLIILGSWVESMHYLVKSTKGTSTEAGIYKELYNQQDNLMNLISYFSDLNESDETAELKNEMKNWQTKLEQILVKFNVIDMNKGVEQFSDVIYQIELLRSEMIK